MKIIDVINEFVSYSFNHNLIKESDTIYLFNKIMGILKIEYREGEIVLLKDTRIIDEILDDIIDYAVTNNAFHHGYASDAYLFLGSFYDNGTTVFRVYAPHASKVSVVGDFNYWDTNANVMYKVDDEGIWETEISNIHIYDNYKYAITNNGRTFLKQDPYGYHFETNSGTSTKVYQLGNYVWGDSDWLQERDSKNIYQSPINIYECHIGSWLHKDGHVLNYRDIANHLIKYVKENYLIFGKGFYPFHHLDY